MRLQERPPLEPDMSMADFKKLLHRQMRDTLLKQYADYLEVVQMSDDPEVKRKCVAMHIQTIGAEHKEKVDPNDNLAVFQFNFTGGGVAAVQMAAPMQTLTVENDSGSPGEPMTLATLDFTSNTAARVALNRDVDFSEDDEC